MGAGSFLAGALRGYTDTARDRKKKQQPSLLSRFKNRKKKKSSPATADSDVPEYKRGGRVRKTGLAKVHRGEYVIPAKRGKKRATKKR